MWFHKQIHPEPNKKQKVLDFLKKQDSSSLRKLTVNDVKEKLGVSDSTVRKAMKEGNICLGKLPTKTSNENSAYSADATNVSFCGLYISAKRSVLILQRDYQSSDAQAVTIHESFQKVSDSLSQIEKENNDEYSHESTAALRETDTSQINKTQYEDIDSFIKRALIISVSSKSYEFNIFMLNLNEKNNSTIFTITL